MNQFEKRQFKIILGVVGSSAILICVIVQLFFHTEAFMGVWGRMMRILEPFLYGAVIAYLLRPLCVWTEGGFRWMGKRVCKKEHPGTRRMLSILCSLVLLFAVLFLLILTVLPEMISSISGLIAQLPGAIDQFQDWIRNLDNGELSHEAVSYVQQMVQTLTDRLENFLQTDVLPNLMNLVSSVTSSFANIFSLLKNFGLGCIVAAYLLGSWEKFTAQAKLAVYGLFRKPIADWIKKEVRYTDRMFSGFIHGKLLDSLIVGLLCFAFCLITRMPYTALISVIVGVTNIIPFFGPYLGAIPSLLLILTVSPVKALAFLVFVVILQQFDGNVLGPKILGDRMGLSGFWIMFAILVAGGLWGLPGMLLGVPLFAVVYDLIRSFLTWCLQRRGADAMLRDYEQRY